MAKAQQKRTNKPTSFYRARIAKLERKLQEVVQSTQRASELHLTELEAARRLDEESNRLELNGMKLHAETLGALGRNVLDQIQLENGARVRLQLSPRLEQDFLLLKEAAPLVRRSVVRIRKLCQSGAIASTKDARGRILVNTDSLRAWFFGR